MLLFLSKGTLQSKRGKDLGVGKLYYIPWMSPKCDQKALIRVTQKDKGE